MIELFSLDVETKCAAVGCDGFYYKEDGTKELCDHALFPHTSRITHIAVYNDGFKQVWHSVNDFSLWNNNTRRYILHGGKFDVRHLLHHGLDIRDQWEADTQLMAVAHPYKIPSAWLQRYNAKIEDENKKLPPYHNHRKGTPHSLKTLAPYHLNVKPFWEGLGHQSDEYVLLDVEYTWRLYGVLDKLLKPHYIKFYQDSLFPWVKTVLLPAELAGIKLDLPLLDIRLAEARAAEGQLEQELNKAWEDVKKRYREKALAEIKQRYEGMKTAAIRKMKTPTADKISKVILRYNNLEAKALVKAPPEFNFDSPKDLLWALEDFKGYDVGDLITGKKGTGVEILNRLAGEGKEEVGALIRYRKNKKMVNSFYLPYKEDSINGRLYTSFNPDIARTGRLSSSGKNLQQVTGSLKDLFIPDDGDVFLTADESGVEARFILYYTEDPILYDVVINKDFHSYNAKVFFDLPCSWDQVKERYPNHRKAAKKVGFALFYGAGWRRIKKAFHSEGFYFSDEECKEIYYRFRDEYITSFEFKKHTLDPILEKGGVVTNAFGRPFRIEHKRDVYMKGFNTLIQSSASDLVLLAAHKYNQVVGAGDVRLLVHDELTVRARKENAEQSWILLKKCLTDFTLQNKCGIIPLEVEGSVRNSWGDK